MKKLKQLWVFALILVLLSLGGYLMYEKQAGARRQAPEPEFTKKTRVHLDHAGVFFQTIH